MQHALKSATAVVTDEGLFEAIAATWDLDRVGERISQGAFALTIQNWRTIGRPVPCHWDHKGGDPQFVIGTIDPMTMRETPEGLLVEGRLDLDHSAVAREAWRAMRSGSIALSFGFLTLKSHTEGNVKVLDQLDLYEISLTPSPANAATRVLSMKGRPITRIASFAA
jgi:HK97 family phage prohead protease